MIKIVSIFNTDFKPVESFLPAVALPKTAVPDTLGLTWEKVKAPFGKKKEDCERIFALAETLNEAHVWTDAERSLVVDAFYSPHFLSMQSALTLLLSKTKDDELCTLIERGIKKGLSLSKVELNLRPLELIEFQKLLHLYNSDPEKFKKEIALHAELVKEHVDGMQSEIIRKNQETVFTKVMRFLHTFVNMLIDSLGLRTIFSSGLDKMIALLKQMLIVPTALFGLLVVSMSSVAALATTIGISLAALLAFGLFAKFYKRPLGIINNAENLTQKAKQGMITPCVAREKEMTELIDQLQAHRHAMIVGLNGVGKTKLVEGLAQKIAAGDVPNSFKEKSILRIDVSQMIKNDTIGAFRTIFSDIMAHQNDVILFFDNFHEGMKRDTKNVAEILRAFSGHYLTIAAVTPQEYALIETKAGVFGRVDLAPTNTQKSNLVAQDLFRRELTGVKIAPETVDLLVSETNAMKDVRQQPGRVIKAASEIIRRTKCNMAESLETKKAMHFYEIAKLKKEFATSDGARVTSAIETTITHHKEELRRIEEELQDKAEKVAKLKAFETLLHDIKVDNQRLACSLATTLSSDQLQHRWLMENRFLIPYFKQILEEKQKENCPLISPAFVKEVVASLTSRNGL